LNSLVNRKAFTLIELLVVVAIIGILAAVGVVAYNGYTSSAKKKVTETNYKSLLKVMKTQLVQCDINGYMELMSNANDQTVRQISCTSGTGILTPYIINHMANLNFKSPYNNNLPAIVCCGKSYSAGQTYVGVGGNDPYNVNAVWWFKTKLDDDPKNNIEGDTLSR